MKSPDYTVSAYHRGADFDVLERWWRDSGVAPLPRQAMPRLGLWAMHGENRMAAAFAYRTTADLAIMAFAIANPNIIRIRQAEAVAFAISRLAAALRDTCPGIVIVSLCHDQSLHQAYVKRAGFHDTGKVYIAASAPDGVDLDILTE